MKTMFIEPTKDLCAAFMLARKEKKLKQHEVDYRCGWKAPHYAYFERGKKGLSNERVQKIANTLGVELDFGGLSGGQEDNYDEQ